MAYLVRRGGGRTQIRESLRTERGPRSLLLASFRGPLDEGVLDEAARRARRPLDRDALVARARELGIGWRSTANHAARTLARQLGTGRALDPVLVELLRQRLGAHPAGTDAGVAELEEAGEWIGSSEVERGAALRGLLRMSDALVRGRRAARAGGETAQPEFAFPRLDSKPEGTAAPGA